MGSDTHLGRERPILVRQAPLYFLPFSPGMAPQAVNLNQGDMPVTVPGMGMSGGANGMEMSMSGGAEDMPMPMTMFRKQKQTMPKDANVGGAARRGTFCGREERGWRSSLWS